MATEKQSSSAFSEAEKQAMKERAKEAREFKKLSGETQVEIKISEMTAAEQKIARAINDLVLSVSDEFSPRTWYGMPAYYKDGKVICFFQAASKFDSRYSTFGFQEAANLDDGNFWPTSFAITGWNEDIESQIRELVVRSLNP